MTPTNCDLGFIERFDDHYLATLSRNVQHDIGVVWAMLTEPAQLVLWLAPGEIEPRVGGAACLDFVDSGTVIDSTVAAWDPPNLLEYSWSGPGEPERPVRFELHDLGASTRLTLTLGVPEDEDVARSCAGWEAHLEMLLAALEGVPIKFPFERFVATRAAYNEVLATKGA